LKFEIEVHMGFLQRLFGNNKRSGAKAGDQFGHYVYVRCAHCGSVAHSRIDLRNDLSPDDEGNGMIVRKVLVDERCFRPMEALLRFSRSRQLVEQKLDGGEFIDEQAYNEVRSAQPSTTR
jgi:hypothetical protein